MAPAPFRFLFFLYHFPPATSTAAKRNFRIAHHIANRAMTAIAFTAAYPGKQDVPATRLDVRTVRATDYRSWLRRKTNDGYIPEERKQQVWKQWSIKLINTFPFSILAGEGGLLYCLSLIRQGSKAIREHHITHLYSSFRPFADHAAAYWLKRKYPHVCWIADFRDLAVDPFTKHIFFPGAHQRLFKRMFSRADLLTTVSDGLARQLSNYNAHVYTLRNGITGSPAKPLPVKTSHFTIVYTGSMMLDNRNPRPVFTALRQLISEAYMQPEHLQIIYAGKDGKAWDEMIAGHGLTESFINHNIIPASATLQLQQDACINLLLSIASPDIQGMLTGKLIEYIEAGCPILAISVDYRDAELNSVLHDVGIGESFSDRNEDLPAIRDFIRREYDAWKQTGYNRKPVNWPVVTSTYNMQSIIDQFVAHISPATLDPVMAPSPR